MDSNLVPGLTIVLRRALRRLLRPARSGAMSGRGIRTPDSRISCVMLGPARMRAIGAVLFGRSGAAQPTHDTSESPVE